MKISMRAVAAGIIVSAIAAPTFAQSIPLHPAVPGMTMPAAETRADYRHDKRFQEYLSHHPGVRRDLERNPDLINDPEFVKKHPEFHEFLERHRKVRNTVEDRAVYKEDHAADKAERKYGTPEAGEPAVANATGPVTAKETRAERRAAKKAAKHGAATNASATTTTH
ncbi:MAG TPA: hypothetical protein VEU51_09410 [Candidatus Acidoferrales bacterium]|nr:hypothetical protein [Candidatus Acidoferrales bacterium]